ncbi:MAG: hypothetical protein IJI57_08030 [Flexilinea sp.]|nr:hypothetical protein [Flexilinea sp.]
MEKDNSIHKIRDYSKPLMLNLQGEKGLRAYIQIIKSPRTKYDAKAASEKAKENLRKQGVIVNDR